MATINLGKVLPSYKGTYSAGTYQKQDVVFDGESSFISLVDNNITPLSDDGVNWRYLCRGNYNKVEELELKVKGFYPDLNCYDLIQKHKVSDLVISKGVTFTWDGSVCHVEGLSSGYSQQLIASGLTFNASDLIYLRISTSNPQVFFRIITYDSNQIGVSYDYTENAIFEVPTNIVSISLLVRVLDPAYDYNDDITISVLNSKTNIELTKDSNSNELNISINASSIDELIRYNTYNVLYQYGNFSTSANNGLTYTWEDNRRICHAVGTLTAYSNILLIDSAISLLKHVQAGITYRVKLSSNKFRLVCIQYANTQEISNESYYNEDTIVLLQDTTSIKIYLYSIGNSGLINETFELLLMIEQNDLSFITPERIDEWNRLANITPLASSYFTDNIGTIGVLGWCCIFEDVPVTEGEVLHILCEAFKITYSADGYNSGYAFRGFAFKDENKNVILGQASTDYHRGTLYVPENAKYVSVCLQYQIKDTPSSLGENWLTTRDISDHLDKVVPLSIDSGNIISISAIAESTQKDTKVIMNSQPYCSARKPCIAFILDVDAYNNENMHDVFISKNVRCGFAIGQTVDYNRNAKYIYRIWQDQGFEVIAHGKVVLNPSDPEYIAITYEDALADIQLQVEEMKADGFIINEFVGKNGLVDSSFMPIIKRYFDAAYTSANHVSSQESCYIFGTDHPYELWRYSLESANLLQAKAAVDRAISLNTTCVFYGHATLDAETAGNFTPSNIDELIDYIQSKDVCVKTPYEAVRDMFAVRYDDLVP